MEALRVLFLSEVTCQAGLKCIKWIGDNLNMFTIDRGPSLWLQPLKTLYHYSISIIILITFTSNIDYCITSQMVVIKTCFVHAASKSKGRKSESFYSTRLQKNSHKHFIWCYLLPLVSQKYHDLSLVVKYVCMYLVHLCLMHIQYNTYWFGTIMGLLHIAS